MIIVLPIKSRNYEKFHFYIKNSNPHEMIILKKESIWIELIIYQHIYLFDLFPVTLFANETFDLQRKEEITKIISLLWTKKLVFPFVFKSTLIYIQEKCILKITIFHNEVITPSIFHDILLFSIYCKIW